MSAPSHGIVWRKDPLQIVKKYQEWAAQKPEPRAVILYDTMWHGTRRMAEAIGEGLAESGVDFKILNLAVSDRNDVLVEVFKARPVLVGSSTINNGVLPTIMPVMTDIKGLKFKNKIGAAFGSYGWSGEAPRLVLEVLKYKFEMQVPEPPILARDEPNSTILRACQDLGKRISEMLIRGT